MELKINGTIVLHKNITSKKKIVINQGGTRSSKTYSICQSIIIECFNNSKKLTYSILRKTLPALKRSAMKDFFDILNELGLYNQNNHNKTENIYYLNGNEIQFFSVDDQQKVRGTKRDLLWVNEANEIEYEDFLQLLMRTSGRVFLDFNPDLPDNHWLYENVIDSREDVDLIISTYKDNPFLPKKQVEEIERFKNTNSVYWTVFGLGQRSDVQRGTVFNRNNYNEYEILPSDIKSVVYCDPNLALKTKGDTTAIVCLGYSANTNKYYIVDAVLHSFSDSDELLNTVFNLRYPHTIGLGFDGNVSQESTWTNFVKNWAKIHDRPFPRIEYKRYKVDDLSKNILLSWCENRILFPPGFNMSTQGKMFLAQLYSFTSKKAGSKDDAPDALICAFEFIHERRAVKNNVYNAFAQQPKILLETF